MWICTDSSRIGLCQAFRWGLSLIALLNSLRISGPRMTINQTLNQSLGEQMRAEELSLRSTVPPSQVPGYRMERLLGQGAYGQVWIATNLNTGRTVAIKFYLHRAGVNWSLLTREVRNLVSMSGNRAIVQVLEVGWDSEPPYYVMEYLENGSLDDLIRNRGAIGAQRAVELFTGIAMGLNHSHGKGVLHCDLKPANVLLDQDMQPRIADFGQSRLSNEQTPSLGTLFFMAPEQADLNAVPDARWDVYALGAILYCMVVGTPPYRTPETVSTLDTANSLSERLKRYRDTILKSPYPRGHYRVSGVDRWLCSIIDRCIAKKPDDRFDNVQQVLAALERRNISRLRVPLMILGILGPLLLATIMGLSFWRAVSVAESDLSNELREGALQSNFFAAQSAAGTLESEIAALQKKWADARRDVYGNLTPWQRIQIVRHPQRPYLLDYLRHGATELFELGGDRAFGEDRALIGGLATLDGQRVVFLGHQKGRDTKENLLRNFGCAHPEGYRKALRLMRLADRFRLPIITFIDINIHDDGVRSITASAGRVAQGGACRLSSKRGETKDKYEGATG